MGKKSVARRFDFWHNTTKAAVKGRKMMFAASLRGEIYDWTRTGSKRIK